MKKSVLREGFTTGTAATAAAMAATRLALGQDAPFVRVPLPPFETEACTTSGIQESLAMHPPGQYWLGTERFWDLAPAFCRKLKGAGMAIAGVIKDSGDDPDATNGLMIKAMVTLRPEWEKGTIVVKAGLGVGVATLPGLPVSVGSAAINPVPMSQIRRGVAFEFETAAWQGGGEVRIIVPGGVARAGKTLNPRLGIVGGISILGTQGVVRPYSHEAWLATIDQGLRVAWNLGLKSVGLSTGRRSERLLMREFPEWPEQCFIQAADHMRFSVKTAAKLGFRRIVIGLFFGKLVKLAQGIGHTHAHAAPMRMKDLGILLAQSGLEPELAREASQANTALHVLQIMERSVRRKAILEALCRMALRNVVSWASESMPPTSGGVHVTVRLFSPEEHEMASADSIKDREIHEY